MIAFDSCILIAGIQRQDRRGKPFIERCQQYLEQLQKDKIRVILPAPAVWELLAGYPPTGIAKVSAVLKTRFRSAPFNLRAAEIAARIQAAHGLVVVKNTTGKALRANSLAVREASRQHIKLDIAVLATAIAAQATTLITDESKELEKFRRWAEGWPITVSPIPKVDVQTTFDFDGQQ
jgi:hypothetical protein